MTDREDEIEIDVDRAGERDGDRSDELETGQVDDDASRDHDRDAGRDHDRDAGWDHLRDVDREVDHVPRPATDDDVGDEGSPGRLLADELGRIDLRTTPEGYVEGRVTNLEPVDDRTVRLTVRLPHGETTAFELEKPIPWSDRFLLARLVEDVGYDAASIDHLVGESVYVARIDAGPTAPDDGRERRWWAGPVRDAGNAVLAAVGGDLRLEEAGEPEWRLVDPLERPDESDDGGTAGPVGDAIAAAAVGLVALGAVLAAAGAVVGTTGSLAVTGATALGVLPGLAVLLVGLVVLLVRRR